MKRLALLTVCVSLLAACSRNIQTTEAVHDGVVAYLSGIASKTGLDMNSMQVDVTAVSFQRDEARATVSIRPKSVQNSAGMQIVYTLDRKGDKWVVRGPGEASGSAHGAPPPITDEKAPLPAGHPPVGGSAPPSGTLPEGHPPINK